jgi:hypothetical protein
MSNTMFGAGNTSCYVFTFSFGSTKMLWLMMTTTTLIDNAQVACWSAVKCESLPDLN